jgi:hypothetical protein
MVIQMRRLLIALVALSVGALALLGGPTVASASPRAAAPSSGTCPGGLLEPGPPNATIMSSTTTPVIGQSIEASGIVYCPNESVDLTIAGVHVGTAHTDSMGKFDPAVIVPGPVGDKPLCGVGASGLATDQDCLILHVRASTTGTTSNPPGSTGAEVATLIAVAVVLLGGGALFVAAGRRRKSSV